MTKIWTVALLGIMVLLAACGGGEELTLEDIDAPAEVRDGHKELVDGATDLAEAFGDVDFEGLFSELEAVESLSDVEELFGQLFSSEFIAALERMENACSELKVIASDNSFDLDLACG